jgi:uncharacterized membrane protein YedE/YeeE
MKPRSMLAVLAGGALFGFGLALSRMIQPEVVLSFLQFDDFGLMLVLGGAVLVTAVVYGLAPKLMRAPVLEPAFSVHALLPRRQTIVGAAIFGAGWGLCGVCPGPAIAGLGAGNWPLLFAVAGIALGAWVQGVVFGGPADD